MHVTKKYQTAVTIFGREGGVWRYRSIKAVVHDLGLNWIAQNVGAHFRVYSHTEYIRTEMEVGGYADRARPVYKEAQYIMRDDAGKPVGYAHCCAVVRAGQRYLFSPEYTGGPVRGTGRRRRYRSIRRHVSYINALRAAQTFVEEGEVPVRNRRSKGLERDPWDDYAYRHLERNWKKFRKTQWK